MFYDPSTIPQDPLRSLHVLPAQNLGVATPQPPGLTPIAKLDLDVIAAYFHLSFPLVSLTLKLCCTMEYYALCTMLNLELCWSSPSHLGFTASAVIHTACTTLLVYSKTSWSGVPVLITFLERSGRPTSEFTSAPLLKTWIEFSAPCAPLFRLWDHNIGYQSGASPKPGTRLKSE